LLGKFKVDTAMSLEQICLTKGKSIGQTR